MKLKGKVAVITGAGQGIGRSYAIRLIEDGAAVVIADNNQEKGEAVEKELTGKGGAAKFIKTDVTSQESVQNMVNTACREFGKIDILVNNASIFSTIKMKPFEQLSLEEWSKVLEVNLTGVFICSQAVVPIMRKNNFGRIINVSSSTILAGRPYYIHYVSSKAGVAGFSRALAREVGNDNITVNTLAPGATATEIERDTISSAQMEANLKMQCIHRQGTTGDLVGTVSFLCSDDASFITGQLINVDGGKMFH